MHGTFTRALLNVEHYILSDRLRGYVSSHFIHAYWAWRSVCTYQFKYGRLIGWRYRASDIVSEIATIAGECVHIYSCSGPSEHFGNVFVYLPYGSVNAGHVEVVRVTEDTVIFNQESRSCDMPDDKVDVLDRLAEVDWREALAPYLARGPLKLA
jgi:hypothetical protein